MDLISSLKSSDINYIEALEVDVDSGESIKGTLSKSPKEFF